MSDELTTLMIDRMNWQILLLFGVIFCLSGGLLNVMAVSINGGKMPIYSERVFDTNSRVHFVTNNISEINDFEIVDKYKLFGKWYYSLGDILIIFGVLVFVLSLFVSLRDSIKIARIESRIKLEEEEEAGDDFV